MPTPDRSLLPRMMVSGSTALVAGAVAAATTYLGADASPAVLVAFALLTPLGGAATSSLATDLHKEMDRPAPDPDARRWNNDILRAAALAIHDIIKAEATTWSAATQASLAQLAKNIAHLYDELDDAQPMAVVTEAEIKANLVKGDAFLHEPAGDPAVWTAFLHSVIQSHGPKGELGNEVLPRLGEAISERFNAQLFQVLKFDFDTSGSPIGGQAYASITLRLLMQCAASDDKLLPLITKLNDVVGEGVRAIRDGLSEVDETTKQIRAHQLADTRDPIIAYSKALRERYANHENLGLPAVSSQDEKDVPIPICELFVPPACTEQHHSPAAFDELVGNKKNPAMPLLPRLAQQPRTVLLADPGMGKSTLIQWLIVCLADRKANDAKQHFPQAVPLPFVLRDLVPLLPPDHKLWTWNSLLEVFCRYKTSSTATQAFAHPLVNDEVTFDSLLASPRAFFLIDGLDEIGDPKRRLAMRRVLWEGFKEHPQARFLVTSRIVGYDEAVVDEEQLLGEEAKAVLEGRHSEALQSIAHDQATDSNDVFVRLYHNTDIRTVHAFRAYLLYLAPFDDTQQDLFAQHWYKQRLGGSAGRNRAEQFIAAVRRHPSTRVIARVPNLLYLLALLYRHKAHLPDGRAAVYAAISEAYLEGIDLDKHLPDSPGLRVTYTLQEKERFLATLGAHMQVQRSLLAAEAAAKKEKHSGEVLADKAQIEAWLAPHFNGAKTQEDCDDPHKFIGYVAARAGLLLPRDEGVFAFAHLSFQEYYAARHLQAEFNCLRDGRDEGEPQPHPEILTTVERLREWTDDPSWHEVFIFLVESEKENKPRTKVLIEELFLADAALITASKPDIHGQPLRHLPSNAARLLASLSLNRDLALSEAQRQRIWTVLWQTQLRAGLRSSLDFDWHIAPCLSQASHYQSQVLKCLSNLAATTTELNLSFCEDLTDLSFLSMFNALRQLNLLGCGTITSLEPLRGLPLESLSLSYCRGISSLEVLRGMPLKWFGVAGCDDHLKAEAEALRATWAAGCYVYSD